MTATIFDIPVRFKKTLPDVWTSKNYQVEEKQWIEDLEDWVRDNFGVGQYIGRTLRFGVADGQAEYMVKSLSPVELIHLPLMDGYSFQYAHLMTASEIKKQIDADDRMTAFLNSWKSQKVGDVEAVLKAHGIKSDEPREGYMHVEWLYNKYLLPIYDSSHGYDHGIYKYLCNLKMRTA